MYNIKYKQIKINIKQNKCKIKYHKIKCLNYSASISNMLNINNYDAHKHSLGSAIIFSTLTKF